MLPIAIVTNPTPVQVPLVNTTLPGSAITHVPYDNVAPSISSSQVNNNASPNSTAAAASDQPDVPQAADAEEQAAAATNSTAQSQTVGAQATFLAQLMSQDGSPPAQAVLIQYEKLSAIGLAKYKPSNAMKPAANAPSSAFGQLLQQNKTVVAVPPAATAPQAAPHQTVSTSAANTNTPAQATLVISAAPVAPAPRPSAPPRNSNSTTNSASQIVNAYTQTAARATTQSLDTTEEFA